MLSLHEYTDYRKFLIDWIQNQSPTTKGLQGRLAKAAGVSSSLISLILKGEKHLSLEQALEISEFLALRDSENEYFFLLVEYGKAGSAKLRKLLRKKIDLQSQSLSKRILVKSTETSNETKGIYYSSWMYSGVRNITALPEKHDVHSIARRLNASPQIVGETIEFLLKNGLCKIVDGNLTYGPARTHVDVDSPFVNKHHQNWRLRGFQAMESRNSENLFFTSPMSLSADVAKEIRLRLPKVIEQVMDQAGPSPSEVVYNLNVDWFQF